MPRIQVNFHLYAKDVDRAGLFYEQHLGFKFEGQIKASENTEWAALRTDNAILWLGPEGAQKGLIVLIEAELPKLVARLKSEGVTVIVPDEFKKEELEDEQLTFETDWGRHAWILDSEDNVVMLFEPCEG